MTANAERRLKHWGWGYEDQQLTHEEAVAAAKAIRDHLGFGDGEVERPVDLGDVRLRARRLDVPVALAPICRTDSYERASHALGKSYRDVVCGFRGEFVTVQCPGAWVLRRVWGAGRRGGGR